MARQSALTPEMLAAFQAKGGSIKRAAVGEGLGLTNRQWYRKARDETVERIVDENALIEERHVTGNVVTNGLGEIIGTI